MDLTTIADVVDYMVGASTPEEWNERCNEVKQANGGNYPQFWKSEVLNAGVGQRFWGRRQS